MSFSSDRSRSSGSLVIFSNITQEFVILLIVDSILIIAVFILSVCVWHVGLATTEEGLDSQGLKIYTVLNSYVSSRNQTQVLFKKSNCSDSLSYHSRLQIFNFSSVSNIRILDISVRSTVLVLCLFS